GRPEMGKFSTARCVCGPHRAEAGTCISPRLSFSMRTSGMMGPFWRCDTLAPANLAHADARAETRRASAPNDVRSGSGGVFGDLDDVANGQVRPQRVRDRAIFLQREREGVLHRVAVD